MNIVQREYEKDSKLVKKDVEMLKEWCDGQPHLPPMTEQEVIWFLQSCYFNNEIAKAAIDDYYTMKTMSPEIFRKRDFNSEVFRANMKLVSSMILPMKTHEGHTVCFIKFWTTSSDQFNVHELMKIFDMVVLLDLYLNGTHDGLRLCVDVKNFTFGHIAKLNLVSIKKFFLYLQQAMPVRLKGIHYFNANAALDRVLTIIKPLMKKEIIELLTIHQSLKELEKYVPLECMPNDYGGKCNSVELLNEQTKNLLAENQEFFDHQDNQQVDESKRPGEPKNVSDIFGVDGTFKKLDVF